MQHDLFLVNVLPPRIASTCAELPELEGAKFVEIKVAILNNTEVKLQRSDSYFSRLRNLDLPRTLSSPIPVYQRQQIKKVPQIS